MSTTTGAEQTNYPRRNRNDKRTSNRLTIHGPQTHQLTDNRRIKTDL